MAIGGIGFVELLIVLAGGLLGLPPGERDGALVRTAPRDAIVYFEWSERGTGKAGQPGIDGLAADPEVRAFLAALERALAAALEEQADRNEAQKEFAKSLPALIHALLLRPGCLHLSFDPQAAQTAIEGAGGQPSVSALLAGLKGAIVINGGDQAESMDRGLRALLALSPEPPKTAELNHTAVRLPGLKNPIVVHRHEKYLVAALDGPTVDRVVAGLENKSKGLLENERFVEAEKRVHGMRTAATTWIDVKTATSDLVTAIGPAGPFVETISKLVGANEIDSIVCHTGVVEGEIRSKYLVTTGSELPGILSLAAGRGMRQADFAHIPEDADLVAALSFNASKIYEEAERILAATSIGAVQPMQDAIKRIEDQFGFRLKEDLFAALGDVWTLYDSPSEGGLFVTSLVAGVEVRDKAKARLVFDHLKKWLNDSLPGRRGSFRRAGVVLEERKFLDQTIYFVSSIGGEMPFAPAFCLTDTHLLAALHPQALKAQLRFQKSRGSGGNAKSYVPAFRSAGATIAYGAFDAPKLVGLLYAFAPYAGQAVTARLQQRGAAIDTFALPSARAILPYVGRYTATVTRVEKGILVETNGLGQTIAVGALLMGQWIAAPR